MKRFICNKFAICLLVILIYSTTLESFSQSFIAKGGANYYKHEIALSVLKKVAYAKGDNKPLPTLKISTQKGYVAEFRPNRSSSGSIILDEYVYDICRGFGKDSLNALACVIGHELGHYFLEHKGGFGYSNSEAFRLDNESLIDIEKKADEFGVYYGFIAGYDTRRVLPIVMNKIYASYKLEHKLTGYPSLNERKSIAYNSIKYTTELGHIFEFGTLLFGINKGSAAANCFEFIAPKFPSKEIYNNIGVIYLREYIRSDFKMDSINKFMYPFEFDAQSRLLKEKQLRSSNFDTWIPEIEVIRDYFMTALKLDNTYIAANVNLATVYVLMGDYDSASGQVNQLEKRLEKIGERLPEAAYSIRGISKALSGNFIIAKENFNNVNLSSDINNYNKVVLNALSNKEPSYFEDFSRWLDSYFKPEEVNSKVITTSNEKVGGIFINSLKLDDSFIIKDLDGYEDIAYKKGDGYTIYCIIQNGRIQFSVIHADNYHGMTNSGVRIGSTVEDVLDKYGRSYEVLVMRDKQILSYLEQKISFIVNNGQVTSWYIW